MVIRSVGSLTTAARKIQFNMNLILFIRILIKVIKTKSYSAPYNVYKPELYINNVSILDDWWRVYNYRVNPAWNFSTAFTHERRHYSVTSLTQQQGWLTSCGINAGFVPALARDLCTSCSKWAQWRQSLLTRCNGYMDAFLRTQVPMFRAGCLATGVHLFLYSEPSLIILVEALTSARAKQQHISTGNKGQFLLLRILFNISDERQQASCWNGTQQDELSLRT